MLLLYDRLMQGILNLAKKWPLFQMENGNIWTLAGGIVVRA